MKVRVTLFPDVELDVNEREYEDLKAQGLLVDAVTAPSRAVEAPKTAEGTDKPAAKRNDAENA